MINIDIVIVGDNNQTYKVPSTTWMKPQNKIQPEFAGDAGVVVKRGALLAEVPKPDQPVGYYCILVNFSEVEGAPFAPDHSADNNGNFDIGTDGLVIHMPHATEARGAFYVMTQAAWEALVAKPEEVKLSRKLAENGALCATTEEGLLVNLARIGPAGG